MGRPALMDEATPVTIKFPGGALIRFREEAASEGITVAEYVRRLTCTPDEYRQGQLRRTA